MNIFAFKIESQNHSAMSNCLQPHGLYSPWNSLGQNTGMGSFSLLLGISPTQGSNPGLPHCRQILYQLSHKGSPPSRLVRKNSQLLFLSHMKLPPSRWRWEWNSGNWVCVCGPFAAASLVNTLPGCTQRRSNAPSSTTVVLNPHQSLPWMGPLTFFPPVPSDLLVFPISNILWEIRKILRNYFFFLLRDQLYLKNRSSVKR